MAQIDWKKRYAANTISSYLNTGVRMVVGLLLIRLLYESWELAEVGFWFFMWSIFGYAIFLDFGLGVAVQKIVAQRAAADEIEPVNRLLTTVFWSFAGMGVGLAIVGWFLGDFVLTHASVSAEHYAEFLQAYRIFVVGVAVMLPLGVLPGVLEGLQRIDISNGLRTVGTLIHFSFTWYGLKAGWAFSSIVLIPIITAFVPNICCGIAAGRLMPGLSIHPRWFRLAAVRESLSFSMSSYFITCSNILITQSDRLIIGFAISAEAVGLYIGGFKIAEILMQLSTQMMRVVTPAAANLARHGSKADLQQLYLRSSRFTFLILTPLYVLAAVYLEPLVRLITKFEEVPKETMWVGHLLLLAIYTSEVSASAARRILLMGEAEKRLLKISLCHASFNIVLSILLVQRMGIVGVAVGTLVGNVLFSAVIAFTMNRLCVDRPLREVMGYHVRRCVVPFAVFAAILLPLLIGLPIAHDSGIFAIAWRGAVVMIPTLASALPVIRATWK